MNTQQKINKNKLGLLNLAETLGSIGKEVGGGYYRKHPWSVNKTYIARFKHFYSYSAF